MNCNQKFVRSRAATKLGDCMTAILQRHIVTSLKRAMASCVHAVGSFKAVVEGLARFELSPPLRHGKAPP